MKQPSDKVEAKRAAAIEVLEDLEILFRQAITRLQDYPQSTVQTPYKLLNASIEHVLALAFAMKEVLRGNL